MSQVAADEAAQKQPTRPEMPPVEEAATVPRHWDRTDASAGISPTKPSPARCRTSRARRHDEPSSHRCGSERGLTSAERGRDKCPDLGGTRAGARNTRNDSSGYLTSRGCRLVGDAKNGAHDLHSDEQPQEGSNDEPLADVQG